MNAIEKIIAIITCVFFLWVGASWVEVVGQNREPDPVEYSEYNFFITMSRWVNDKEN